MDVPEILIGSAFMRVLGSAVAVIFLLLSSWCSAVVLTFSLGTTLITPMFLVVAK